MSIVEVTCKLNVVNESDSAAVCYVLECFFKSFVFYAVCFSNVNLCNYLVNALFNFNKLEVVGNLYCSSVSDCNGALCYEKLCNFAAVYGKSANAFNCTEFTTIDGKGCIVEYAVDNSAILNDYCAKFGFSPFIIVVFFCPGIYNNAVLVFFLGRSAFDCDVFNCYDTIGSNCSVVSIGDRTAAHNDKVGTDAAKDCGISAKVFACNDVVTIEIKSYFTIYVDVFG